MSLYNSREVRKIEGLTSAGTIGITATEDEIDNIKDQLLKLSVTSNLASILAACEIAPQEHSDPIVYTTLVHIVGCSIFANALEDTVAGIEQAGDGIIRTVASACQEDYMHVKEHVNNQFGHTDMAKRKFLNDLKEFLNNTIAMNIQGFTVGVAAIIK